uniref:B30.2/SPRY domain-containing protein n=1 Tax=Oryzias latipes TaxID=8090 RepID=A0A3B3HBJ6_ORYLA
MFSAHLPRWHPDQIPGPPTRPDPSAGEGTEALPPVLCRFLLAASRQEGTQKRKELKSVGGSKSLIWEKMKEKVHFSPVLLDPNTANRWLHLSGDLTGVRNGETPQQLPDNPERHMKYSNVFGSEGFSSGRHGWEVEVGDHPHWNIGVAKESVNRRDECSASPKYGIWCLVHREGKYTNGDGQTVTLTTILRRIRVQLDYDGEEVTFSDAEDKADVYTHRDTFTEKLFPYFLKITNH